MSENLTIGVCGMSHLGLIYSTAFAALGVHVVCYDNDEAVIRTLAGGGETVDEPDLYETIARNGDRQRFTAHPEALASCDIVYIAKDVATDDKGNSDLSEVEKIIGLVVPQLKKEARLVVLCQVMPGYTRALSQKLKQVVYYQVETLVFGRAMERATQPERYIVGCGDKEKGLDTTFRHWLEMSHCPVIVMSYESAELSKIAINFCLIASVSTANLLAEMCENIGADWGDIKPSLHLDKRIGPHAYLKPGLGISGGNLERDMRSIVTLGARHGVDTHMVEEWMALSAYRKQWALRALQRAVSEVKGLRVAVWGLAYKENTNSIKNSPSIETIASLAECHIQAHDPVVKASQLPFSHVTLCDSPLDALKEADALLVMTPWDAYKGQRLSGLLTHMRGSIVIDPYGLLIDDSDVVSHCSYYVMGRLPIEKEVTNAKKTAQ